MKLRHYHPCMEQIGTSRKIIRKRWVFLTLALLVVLAGYLLMNYEPEYAPWTTPQFGERTAPKDEKVSLEPSSTNAQVKF